MVFDTLMALWLLLAPGVAHGPPPLPLDAPPGVHAAGSDKRPGLDPNGLNAGETEKGAGLDPNGLTVEEQSGDTELGPGLDPNG